MGKGTDDDDYILDRDPEKTAQRQSPQETKQEIQRNIEQLLSDWNKENE